jgi:hypothetical protein
MPTRKNSYCVPHRDPRHVSQGAGNAGPAHDATKPEYEANFYDHFARAPGVGSMDELAGLRRVRDLV